MTIEAKTDPTLTPLVPPKVAAGLIAGEVDAEDVGSHGRVAAVAEPAPRVESDDEVLATIARLAEGLGREDRLVLRRVLQELPFVALVARCEAATRSGVEADKPATAQSGLVTSARGSLLSTLNRWRLVVGLPALRREGVGPYLRGEENGR